MSNASNPEIIVTDKAAPPGHVTVSMPGQPSLTVLNEPKMVADAVSELNREHNRG